MSGEKFWETKSLSDMTPEEWESLCDGCGKCCVLKLQDEDTEEIFSTDVGCKLLNCQTAKCSNYTNRKSIVPDCIILTPETLSQLSWMPKTCAYRRLDEGKSLPDWHPLITGQADSPKRAGHSVAGRIFPETTIADEDMPDHITDWDECS